MRLVEVTWLDAFMSLKTYTKENASKRKGAQELKTIGYLVHEDKTRVVLAMQENMDTVTEVRHLIWIPKISILKTRVIKEQDTK